MHSVDDMIDIGHTRIGHRKIGSGPDVVFIHGWPLHRETWRNVVPHLDGYTCHLIDLPFAGTSVASPATPLTVGGSSDSLISVLDALGLDSYSLVGHDSGALIARLVAEKRSAQTKSLVVADSEIPGHRPWQLRAYLLTSNLPASTPIMKRLLSSSAFLKSPLGLGGCFHDTSLIGGEFSDVLLKPMLADPVTLEKQMAVIRSFDWDLVDSLAEVHPNITAPTLLIWGDEDAFFPADKARAMADQFAGPTEFETIANARLFAHEEHPKRFAELCRDFLNRHVQPGLG